MWAHFWGRRKTLTPPALSGLTAEEAEFLPAALALQAKPVSPAARWVALLLIALVAVGLAWSVFGRMDIVVNAQGKLIAQGQNKVLAAVETARVHALHVEEGQAVRAGQLLIELDTRLSDTDQRRSEQEQQTARLHMARAEALLAALAGGRRRHAPPGAGRPGQRARPRAPPGRRAPLARPVGRLPRPHGAL